jgi:hypothetical protein
LKGPRGWVSPRPDHTLGRGGEWEVSVQTTTIAIVTIPLQAPRHWMRNVLPAPLVGAAAGNDKTNQRTTLRQSADKAMPNNQADLDEQLAWPEFMLYKSNSLRQFYDSSATRIIIYCEQTEIDPNHDQSSKSGTSECHDHSSAGTLPVRKAATPAGTRSNI